ncbi:GNAT family N-acetyltransferase [Massilia horti]|uniref:GNAT family N-acetyltransferase n=1 Tax=Massilia horti TaxID=2562153 RepID=A0A4Y9SZ67_9BURK|nr:GNAT family N-acetyltransferase [Massilia horti]TFW30669.1 GNAT family N-acetyltransferase [Massilia horti]
MTWILTPAREFAAHAAAWQQLNTECTASPLLEPAFVAPLLTEFGDGSELLARFERDGRLLAMAIVQRRRIGAWETFQPSQAPVGMWLSHPGLDIDMLTGTLLRALPGFALVLGVTQRDPMLAPRPLDGALLRTLDYIDTARITIRGSFDDYWAARGKNLRTNMKKQRSKLQKEGVEAHMEVVRDPQQVAAALADYGQLESAGWKAGGGTAIHADNAQGRFYRAMLENFCRAGRGRILRYRFDDRLVAMNLCIEGNGALIILKTTYDESVSSQYSPAFLLCEEVCRELFEQQQFERLEFYGKVMEWHTRWTDEVRTMYHVNSYRWAALPRLRKLINNRARPPQAAPAPAAPALQQTTPSME